MKKRCTILVLYDKDGVFDDYVFYLINELKQVSAHVIAVINGFAQKKYHKKIEKVCDDVIPRENTGYDAGAYQYVFNQYLSKEDLQNYDEIIFCNDTFFGPFIPFIDIFDTMDKRQCDFWGLTFYENGFSSCIQSYFICFRKSIIKNNELHYFWEQVVPKKMISYDEVCKYYEAGIFEYLNFRYYKFDTFISSDDCFLYVDPDYYIKKLKCPILKKRVFTPQYYNAEKTVNALKVIMSQYNYDINLILSHIDRCYAISKNEIVIDEATDSVFQIDRKPHIEHKFISYEIINFFYYNFDKMYIYGTGQFEKHTSNYFLIKAYKELIKFEGYVVSEGHKTKCEHKGYPLYEVIELARDNKCGILVLLNYENSLAVKLSAPKHLNLLYLYAELND